MPNLTEIIRQIQRDLNCPVCGRKYETDEIKLRGLFDNTLMVQTICGSGHMTLFVTSLKDSPKTTPIGANDVIDLHKTLENFTGDFTKIWNK
jgi:hypothetical protein